MKLRHLFLIFATTVLAGCTTFNTDNRLEEAFAMADCNWAEAEKVLAHYERDSMEKEAAKFLIRNMPGHYSYVDTAVIVRYSHSVDPIIETMKGTSSNSLQNSVNLCVKHFSLTNLKKCQDIKSISSTYLIKNIDEAFGSWQKVSWAAHISFHDFCEFTLPYELEELHLLDDWFLKLEKFHSKKMHGMNRCEAYRNSTLEACRTLIRDYSGYMKPNIDEDIKYPIMKWETMPKVPFGTCDYYTFLSLALLPRKGAIVISVPHWACHRLGHTWNVLISENGFHYPFDAPGSLLGKVTLFLKKRQKSIGTLMQSMRNRLI